MRSLIVGLVAVRVSAAALAGVNRLDCSLPHAEKPWVLSIVMDDDAQIAEVISHGVDAPCTQTNTCTVSVYSRSVLPSTIRLTLFEKSPGLMKEVRIDVDRRTLSVFRSSNMTWSIALPPTVDVWEGRGTCRKTVLGKPVL